MKGATLHHTLSQDEGAVRTGEVSFHGADRTSRILYLVGQLGLGGLERQLWYLLRSMDRSRYTPAVVVWNFSPDDPYVHEVRALGVPVCSFPAGTSRVVKLRSFRRLAAQLNPEVIHSYSFYTNFAAYWAGLHVKAVTLGSVRSDFIFDKMDADPCVGRLSARWPRHQIFNSVSGAETARRGGLFSPRGIYVVRNGLDLQQFRSVNGSATGYAGIVGIGSLLPLKRWDRLLRIIQQVKQAGCECTLRVAGDGPERVSLEKQAHDLGIWPWVQFMGTTHDVPGLLEQSRFLVHTSDTEGCPNVVMEAMACGRPVVATDVGDIPWLIDDGKNGFVVPRGDEAAFADRVVRLLSDQDLCHRMGLAARTKAEQEFGLDRVVSETLAAYRAAGWAEQHEQ